MRTDESKARTCSSDSSISLAADDGRGIKNSQRRQQSAVTRTVRNLSLVRWFQRQLRHCQQQQQQQQEQEQQQQEVADPEQLMALLPWMVPRTRPRSLQELARSSGLSCHQLRRLYAKFKQECPNGLMRRESFQEICGFFFPLGEASLYAGLLFDSFLADADDKLCFEQLVSIMSLLSRGTRTDRVRWLFRLYDADKDGVISQQDLLALVTGVYNLCGFTNCRPPVQPQVTAASVAQRLFVAMDTNADGCITWEEFCTFLDKKLESQGDCSDGRSFWAEMDPLSDL